MSKFNVGDKVRVKQNFVIKGCMFPTMRKYAGITGTITEEEFGDYRIDSVGHLWWNVDSIEFVTESEQPRREFIVIRRSGAETIAELRHDREVIKSAKATCAPSDTFDFTTGAKLAFDRLMGREEPKPEPKPVPEPPKLFSVGDRVFTSIGAGYIKQVDVNSESMPYYISYDSGVTLWRRSDEAKPEPPKFYTGKVFACDSQDAMFKKRDGYIFEFSNGLCVNAKPDQSIPSRHVFMDISDIRKHMSLTTWHEVNSDV